MAVDGNKRKKITQILAEETFSKSYKAHKYSLDSTRSSLEYNETEDKTFVWMKRGETDPPPTYKSLIQRYKYDKEKRREYYGDRPTPYDDVDEKTGNITSEWWAKFNALNARQRDTIERIISEHKFTDEDIYVGDKDIEDVLRYYQIKRDGR